MKKIILYLLLVFVSCTHNPSNEEKAQLVVKEMLNSFMKNPESYEAVSFGTLDSLYSAVTEEDYYIRTDSLFSEIKKLQKSAEFDLNRTTESIRSLKQLSSFATVNTNYLDKKRQQINELLNKYNRQADSLQNKLDSITTNFSPAFIGYSIEHQLKYVSTAGLSMEQVFVFYLDPDIPKVYRFKDNMGVVFEYIESSNKYEPNYDNIHWSWDAEK